MSIYESKRNLNHHHPQCISRKTAAGNHDLSTRMWRVPMASYGFLWLPMGSHGFLWVPVLFPKQAVGTMRKFHLEPPHTLLVPALRQRAGRGRQTPAVFLSGSMWKTKTNLGSKSLVSIRFKYSLKISQMVPNMDGVYSKRGMIFFSKSRNFERH